MCVILMFPHPLPHIQSENLLTPTTKSSHNRLGTISATLTRLSCLCLGCAYMLGAVKKQVLSQNSKELKLKNKPTQTELTTPPVGAQSYHQEVATGHADDTDIREGF